MAIIDNLVGCFSCSESRYQSRALPRQKAQEHIKSHDLMKADSPERVRMRLTRLTRQSSLADDVKITDGTALERVIGRNDFMSVAYLEQGVSSSRTVGRIHIFDSSRRLTGYGTGFLVGPGLILTNNHVLSSVSESRFSQVEFDYQADNLKQITPSNFFELDPDALFLTDKNLDYTLVAVRDRSLNGRLLEDFGWNQLVEEEGKIIIGEFVSIIQHPNGEPKQVALRENQVIDVLEDFLHYQTDTAPGSSGSPVYNDQWEVVALHHSGVPKRNGQGQLLTVDGKIWTPDQGERSLAWVANEGVRISRVLRHIKSRSLDSARDQLRDRLFATKQLTLISNSAKKTVDSAVTGGGTHIGVEAGSDGSFTWSIPLRVTVNLGLASVSAAVNQSPNRSPAIIQPPAVPLISAPSSSSDVELMSAIDELSKASSRVYYDEVEDKKRIHDYYKEYPKESSREEFTKYLMELVSKSHTKRLKYQPASQLYPWVDLQPNLKLSSIYSNIPYDPEVMIREDFRIGQERMTRLREKMAVERLVSPDSLAMELDLLEASMPYNCEHSVPQSWFGRSEPMRGDLHHLFACEVRCNSFRSNFPYFDFDDYQESIRDDCGKLEMNKFEPHSGKGIVARAVFYFLIRYPGYINRTPHEYEIDSLPMLLEWHDKYPVTLYEMHRNAAIEEKQGNRNPFIDFPEWGHRVDFSSLLGK